MRRVCHVSVSNQLRQTKRGLLSLFVIVLLLLTFSRSSLADQNEPEGNDWDFFIQLNLWVPEVNAKTTSGADIEISTDEIFRNLDFTFLGTLGAKRGNWTFLADVVYLDLEHSDNYNLGNNDLLQLELTNVELKAWVVTPMVAYNILASDRVSLDLLVGARYLWLGFDTKTRRGFLSVTREESNSKSFDVWNGIIGVRGEIDLPGKWFIPYYFDAGTGDNKLTWQAYAAGAYRFGRIDLHVGYRHLQWEFDEDDTGGKVFDDLKITGPMIGIKYRF